MRVKALAARWQLDDAGTWLSLLIDPADARQARAFAGGMDKAHTAELKVWRPVRSLDANAYLWVLIDRLAEKLALPPAEVYRGYIPDVAGNSVIWPVRDELAQEVGRMWCKGHLGRIAEDLGPCRNTPGYRNLRCYIGSSDYNSAQMSRPISLVVADCREQGIETMTPQQLAALMEGWDAKTDKGALDQPGSETGGL